LSKLQATHEQQSLVISAPPKTAQMTQSNKKHIGTP